ncbi:MAG: hypothetical protein AAB799_01860 [Patescibacteria group bacterium]
MNTKTKTKLNVKQCGLCGKKDKLIRTECCKNWICNDEDNYVLFSYAHNSCSRNHRRFTLCAHHNAEEHSGDWETCKICPGDFETEMYVYYGTNEYNFKKLKKSPKYKPTFCSICKKVISLSEDGYLISKGKYFCEKGEPVACELIECRE